MRDALSEESAGAGRVDPQVGEVASVLPVNVVPLPVQVMPQPGVSPTTNVDVNVTAVNVEQSRSRCHSLRHSLQGRLLAPGWMPG